MAHFIRFIFAAAVWLAAHPALAQTAEQGNQPLLNPGQLDQLVAPVALYPDALLAEVMMASTYPLEVVEAERWVGANKNLTGDELKAAADKQGWDDSVKSLVATPDVLNMMSSQLDWTQKLGDAVLAQQADVMDAVQRLRSKAKDQNKLATTSQQKVSTVRQADRDVIVIEPAAPSTVYVPYYDPAVVYGPWPYEAYPPYFFPLPGTVASAAIATGIAFSAGFVVGAWATHDHYWGGGMNWGGNNIHVNRPVNINNAVVNNWTHNADHRHGVRYSNTDVARKFDRGNNRSNIRSGTQPRIETRGSGGNQAIRPQAKSDRARQSRPSAAGSGASKQPRAGKAAAKTRQGATAKARSAPNRASPGPRAAGRPPVAHTTGIGGGRHALPAGGGAPRAMRGGGMRAGGGARGGGRRR